MKAAILGTSLLAACTSASDQTDASNLPTGTAFVSGVCMETYQAWPYLVSTTDSLFWISPCDSSIRRVSKLDRSLQKLVSNEPHAAMLGADEHDVYWTRIDPTSLRGDLVRASQLDGVPVVLASGQQEMFDDLPQQLVVDDTNVYRSAFLDILSIPKDGSAPQQVVARGNAGPFLAVDADYLYWASMASVHRQRKGTTVDEELATAGTLWEPIAVTQHALFFWDPDNGQLYRIDKTTGGPAIAMVHDWPANRAFISDGVSSLFWQSGSVLVRMAADNGTVTPIAAIHGSASAIAVDAEFIYWLEDSTLYYAPR